MLLWGLRGVLQFQLLRLDLQLTGRDLELGPLGYEIDGFFGAQALVFYMRESLERALFHWKKASNSLISQRQMILNQPESLHPSMQKKCQDSATLGFWF